MKLLSPLLIATFSIAALFLYLPANAQKKLVAVSQSTLTGIVLPAGSKQDSRMIMVISAKALLEIQTKKANTNISKTEILYLPVTSAGFTTDSLTKLLTEIGWTITAVEEDKKYLWLQKENRSVITYFSSDKREPNLYFGEVSSSPVFSGNSKTGKKDTSATHKPTTIQTGLLQPVQTTEVNKNNGNDVPSSTQNNTNKTSTQNGFTFSTTNFDDGWTSTIQEDWVEVNKGNIKVLIHFPKEGTTFPAEPDVLTKAAWNILVSPRYSNLKNFKTSYVEDSKRHYLGMGYATENKTGKSVFVVLFRRGGGWFEVVTPDNISFTQEFLFNPESIRWGSISDFSGGWLLNNSNGVTVKADPEIFDKLENMIGRNKFAVATADLNNTGEWKDRFSSNTFYANYYTGAYAGMGTYSSSQSFEFDSNQTYKWHLVAVNSYGGAANVAQAKSSGSLKMLNNWQILFSNMEGKPKTFDVYFSSIKGGRVLWMNDAKYPGSGIFTGFSLLK